MRGVRTVDGYVVNLEHGFSVVGAPYTGAPQDPRHALHAPWKRGDLLPRPDRGDIATWALMLADLCRGAARAKDLAPPATYENLTFELVELHQWSATWRLLQYVNPAFVHWGTWVLPFDRAFVDAQGYPLAEHALVTIRAKLHTCGAATENTATTSDIGVSP